MAASFLVNLMFTYLMESCVCMSEKSLLLLLMEKAVDGK